MEEHLKNKLITVLNPKTPSIVVKIKCSSISKIYIVNFTYGGTPKKQTDYSLKLFFIL